jgi:predicted XRE-type DNA-binding protein
MARNENRERITESSGNVFADLGFENPEEELAKAKLVQAISKAIDSEALTKAEVAGVLGIGQPDLFNLLRGRTEGYSTDRLTRVLLRGSTLSGDLR